MAGDTWLSAHTEAMQVTIQLESSGGWAVGLWSAVLLVSTPTSAIDQEGVLIWGLWVFCRKLL